MWNVTRSIWSVCCMFDTGTIEMFGLPCFAQCAIEVV